jgi:hypothetical protein
MAAPLALAGVVIYLWKSSIFHECHDTTFILRGRERINWRAKLQVLLKLMFQFELIKQNSIKSFKCDKFVATPLKRQGSVQRSVKCEHSCVTGSDVTSLVLCETHVQGIGSHTNEAVGYYSLAVCSHSWWENHRLRIAILTTLHWKHARQLYN